MTADWRAYRAQKNSLPHWQTALDRYAIAQEHGALRRRYQSIRRDENVLARISRIMGMIAERLNKYPQNRARYLKFCIDLANRAQTIRDRETETEKTRGEFLADMYLRSGIYCRRNESTESRLKSQVKSDGRLYCKVYRQYRRALELYGKKDERTASLVIGLTNLAGRIEDTLNKIPKISDTPEKIDVREYHSYLLLAGLHPDLKNIDKIHLTYYDACRHLRFAQYHIQSAFAP